MPARRDDGYTLLRAYHSSGDPRAREAAVERFLPLARSLARRYHRGSEPLEDLEQVASLALVRAVDRFDPRRGTAFSSYAVPCITGAIKRHFRDAGWSVRVPRGLQELALRLEQIHTELLAATGQSPTAEQFAQHAGVSVEEVLDAREASRAMLADSLDQPGAPHGQGTPPVSETLGHPDEAIALSFERTALGAVLDTLEERDRTIVRLYYLDELTQAEIGRRLGYSQMHISRLLRKAVGQLQLACDAQDRQVLARIAAAA